MKYVVLEKGKLQGIQNRRVRRKRMSRIAYRLVVENRQKPLLLVGVQYGI